MILKQVILKNFKSFKGKIVIDFPAVITAIVGPNGSGKSNIVDAIRWALGEQSFKNIRINKSQDLIFSGNLQESNPSFCEVELIFDNQRKIFNSEYNEISILRRIDRNGNNEYFINHKSSRLKDIIDLTASAKIGLKGFSIINQGAVENIFLVSPQERRIMLEEILGLKNLELKKEEAKRKLEEANINLDKTLALEKEILPRLRFLKRQVARWEKREILEQQLKDEEKKYFISLLHQLFTEQGNEPLNLESLYQKLYNLDTLIKEKENNLMSVKETQNKEIESKIQQITKEIINLQNQKSELLRELGRQEIHSEITYSITDFKNTIIQIKQTLQKLLAVNDLNEIYSEIKTIIQNIDQLLNPSPSKITINPQIQQLQSSLNHLEEELKTKNNALQQNEKILNESNINFRDQYNEIIKLRTQKEEILQLIKKQELAAEKYNLKLNDIKRRLYETSFTFEEIENYYKEQPDLAVSESEVLQIEKHIFRLRKELAEIGIEDSNIIKEYEEVNNRYEFLLQQINDLRKSINDLQILIKELTKEIENTFNKALMNINHDFNRYFRLMFNGGSGKLEQIKKNKLGDSNNNDDEVTNQKYVDSLEQSGGEYWGIDIKIDIPKTNIKSIEILSGGEKTLVAIALLFAIINQSRPPLVIVDEIDAALDEDNSRRFAQILQELCQDTQFIAITHNRMTMTAAQVLYGVTINENNSSQLLSIKFEDSEKILK